MYRCSVEEASSRTDCQEILRLLLNTFHLLTSYTTLFLQLYLGLPNFPFPLSFPPEILYTNIFKFTMPIPVQSPRVGQRTTI